MGCLGCHYPYCNKRNHSKLKVDLKNFISITKVKDTYSREEVEDLLRRIYYNATGKATGIGFVPDWIENNL